MDFLLTWQNGVHPEMHHEMVQVRFLVVTWIKGMQPHFLNQAYQV